VSESRNRKKSRIRVRVYLTEANFCELDSAVQASGATNRSLLISEAINYGLQNLNKINAEGKRKRRIDVRLPNEYKDNVRQLAEAQDITQQSILRYLILQYINDAPWKVTVASTQPLQEETPQWHAKN